MRLPGLRGLPALDVGRRVVREVREDDCAGQAAQLAYYFLFSLFPLLLFLVTLIGYLPIPNLFDRIMSTLGEILPPEALSLVRDNVEAIATKRRGGLLSLGAIVALWSASAGFRAIMAALNRAYDVEEGRPFWKVYGVSILMTLALSVFAVTAFSLLILGPQLGRWLADLVGLGGTFDLLWNLLRWPVSLGFLILILAVVYYVAPDVEQEWRWVTPGSAIAVVGWITVSVAFSFYVQNFGSYDRTYGSLGAVIVLLLWLYLTGFVLLLGGEVNAAIEHLAPAGKQPGAKAQEDTGSAPAAGAARGASEPVALSLRGSSPPCEKQGGGGYPADRPGACLAVPREMPGRAGAPSAPTPADGRPGSAYRVKPQAPGERLYELFSESRRLVGLHVRLLVLELRASARRAATGAALLAAGLVVAAVALLFLLAPLFALLALALPPWLAASIVAVAALAVGGAAIWVGLGRARSLLDLPRRAAAAARAEASWLRGLLRG